MLVMRASFVVRRACPFVAAVVLAACGARSGLKLPSETFDGGRLAADAGRRDAGRGDAGTDGGTPCPACDDGIFCTGVETCDERGTCFPATPPSCDDGDECTVDACDRARDACTHVVSPRDEDGDGVGACSGDCDDGDPTVGPGFVETCDMRDTDCDGRTDEGVLSACLDCRPGCDRIAIPDDVGGRWDVDTDAAGVEVAPDGSLVLSSTRTETYFAWVANYLFGTVTRLDTRDGRQVAEYDSVLRDGTNGAAPPGQECETERLGGNCPSRTAVDLRGSVYVANRAFFGQGTLTKIAGFESDCVDRNGNGMIETSRDLDADGVIERSVPGEFLGQRDECILWTVNVGGVNGVPRAVAIDARGHPWVGLHGESAFLELDPADGRVLRRVSLPGRFAPYGMAADGRGNVWATEVHTGRIIAVDSATGVATSAITGITRDGCSSSYGIAVDERDRVWVAGFLCEAAYRYDQDSRTWAVVPLPDSRVTRGIAADGRGRVYVASSHDWITFAPSGIMSSDPISRLTIIDADRARVERVLGAAGELPGRGTTGVGLDSTGNLWLVNQASSTATRVDTRTFAARDFPTGISPYTYSDFTGYALRTFTAPNGYLRTVIEGCGVGPTEWERVTWDATVPAGTRVELRVRVAGTAADLARATWIGPFTARPTELAMPPGPVPTARFFELELQLYSDGGARSPSIDSLTVQYNCP